MKQGSEFVQFKLRVRGELKARIEAMARDNNRSANAEAVVLLEKALDVDRVSQWINSNYPKIPGHGKADCGTIPGWNLYNTAGYGAGK